jgi:hypothetical protein
MLLQPYTSHLSSKLQQVVLLAVLWTRVDWQELIFIIF